MAIAIWPLLYCTVLLSPVNVLQPLFGSEKSSKSRYGTGVGVGGTGVAVGGTVGGGVGVLCADTLRAYNPAHKQITTPKITMIPTIIPPPPPSNPPPTPPFFSAGGA